MNVAFQQLALTTGAGAVLAAVRQHYALAQRCREHRLIFIDFEAAAAGLIADRKL
jgi:hypothetical protein